MKESRSYDDVQDVFAEMQKLLGRKLINNGLLTEVMWRVGAKKTTLLTSRNKTWSKIEVFQDMVLVLQLLKTINNYDHTSSFSLRP